MICAGQAALRELPAGSRTLLRYEDLLRDPAASLTRLAGFIGVAAPPSWLERLPPRPGRLPGRPAGSGPPRPN